MNENKKYFLNGIAHTKSKLALFKLESSSQFTYLYAYIYGKPCVAYLIGRTVQAHAYGPLSLYDTAMKDTVRKFQIRLIILYNMSVMYIIISSS